MAGSPQTPSIRRHAKVMLFWLLSAFALVGWAASDSPGWDTAVYLKAMDSIRAHRDPYKDSTDIQKARQAELLARGASAPDIQPAFAYVYSPITLPLLRAANLLPRGFLAILYYSIYALCVFATLWVGVQLSGIKELPLMLYAAGIGIYFPGLLVNENILSGNVAYILYGCILVGALHGWRTDRWLIFFAAVLTASFLKTPLLLLTLIAPLSTRNRWPQAIGVITLGIVLFLGQSLLWPSLFSHYLEAVRLLFSINHDFGCSPAGLIANALYRHGSSYLLPSAIGYAAHALLTAVLLLRLSRLYLKARISLLEWAPVLLTGIFFLNPRMNEYDAAPLTLPLALILLRLIRSAPRPRLAGILVAAAMVPMQAASAMSWEFHKILDGCLIALLFLAGSYHLIRLAGTRNEAAVAASV